MLGANTPIQALVDAVVDALREGGRGVGMKVTTSSGAVMTLAVTLEELADGEGNVLYPKDCDDDAE